MLEVVMKIHGDTLLPLYCIWMLLIQLCSRILLPSALKRVSPLTALFFFNEQLHCLHCLARSLALSLAHSRRRLSISNLIASHHTSIMLVSCFFLSHRFIHFISSSMYPPSLLPPSPCPFLLSPCPFLPSTHAHIPVERPCGAKTALCLAMPGSGASTCSSVQGREDL